MFEFPGFIEKYFSQVVTSIHGFKGSGCSTKKSEESHWLLIKKFKGIFFHEKTLFFVHTTTENFPSHHNVLGVQAVVDESPMNICQILFTKTKLLLPVNLSKLFSKQLKTIIVDKTL